MPAVILMAFLSICLLPFAISWLEAPQRHGDTATTTSVTTQYRYNPETLKRLFRIFAQVNGEPSFTPPKKPLFLKVDLDRLDNLDFAKGSVQASGKLSGVWGTDSIGTTEITPKTGYDALKENVIVDNDLMSQLQFPDFESGSFIYDKIFITQQPLPGNKSLWIGEYKFAGTLKFSADLKNYPFDQQSIQLRIQHKVLPAYRLTIQALKPSLQTHQAAELGQYRVARPEAEPTTLMTGFTPGLATILSQRFSSDAALIKALTTTNLTTAWNIDEQSEFMGRRFGRLQSHLFAGSPSPLSTAGIRLGLSRRFASTWLRTIFPVSLSLLIMVMSSYIPFLFITANLGIPPTIFLALVFMQQSSYAQLPQLGYPITLDYYYLFAYICTFLMFIEGLLASTNQEKTPGGHLYTTYARGITLAFAVLGAPIIWGISNLV
ncbi:MAG: hypothetical protein EBU75_10220 [Betaproteobacteria bacterium]|nr:hypothetical protein [Betaproteobacteria bacterium]